MLRFIGKRILWMIPLLFGVTLMVFLILHLTPGDPAALILGDAADQQTIEMLRHEMGLDRPLPVQYLDFVWKAVRGDLGTSIHSKRPVVSELRSRLPATLELACTALTLAVMIGITVGIVSAVKRYSAFDHAMMLTTLVFASMPSFWLGLILMLVFSVQLGWLPAVGRGGFVHLILPAVTLAATPAALIARLTRSSMLDVVEEDYIRTAHAKGLSEEVVIWRHALKNAMIPIITVIGIQFGGMMGGSVVIESVFAWPGVGKLMVDSILTKNYPVVQGGLLMMAVIVSLINLAVDVTYGLLDPRIRYE
ncbi:MAG TPA: peptide ABC transporter [Firmicutes bacterium]|nr:peptide ABC transporter [Bacillota bacterium]